MNTPTLEHVTGAEGYAMAAADGVAPAAEDTHAEETAATTGQYSLTNITDADGYSIAASGLAIVFFALVVVTMFVSILPRVLVRLASVLPEEAAPETTTLAAASGADDGMIAAIGYMMHARRQGGTDR